MSFLDRRRTISRRLFCGPCLRILFYSYNGMKRKCGMHHRQGAQKKRNLPRLLYYKFSPCLLNSTIQNFWIVARSLALPTLPAIATELRHFNDFKRMNVTVRRNRAEKIKRKMNLCCIDINRHKTYLFLKCVFWVARSRIQTFTGWITVNKNLTLFQIFKYKFLCVVFKLNLALLKRYM